ncbi:MAG TPA: protoporphyrinogen oxidase, partial [Candidatus Kapabacteria bacterium]|nr:protoporphyrinogen oxidase [Candidatus Kapabacteria bacterium]
MLDVVIIGAGIRGLTAGFYLLKAGRSVLVLDESDRAGGMIRTINEGGYLLEYGPNSLRGDSHELADLISSLNLQGKIISPAISKPNNFIAIGGKLILVPRSLIGLFRTPILSGRSKRQLLREPFNKSRPENPDDESIASFFRRRIGAEAVEVLVKPMMSGIFAGDAEKLSIRSAFPKLWGYEQTYGSIIKGAIRSKKTAKPVLPRMFSFKDGLSTLPDEIRSALGSSVLLNTSVSAIKHNAGSWTIETTGGNSYEAKNI